MANYDGAYKQLFSLPNTVAAFLRTTLPTECGADLNLDSLERVNGSIVAPNLRGYEADCVWRARSRETGEFVYIIIEFQRTNDNSMMVRFLGYNVSVWEQVLKSQTAKQPEGRLPWIINIVVYNGLTRWKAARTLQEILPRATQTYPELLAPYGYLLVDMGSNLNLDPHTLFHHLNAVESAKDPSEFQESVRALGRHLKPSHDENLLRILATWLREILCDRLAPGSEIPNINDFFTMETLLESNIRSWVQQWKQEGMEQGLQKGLQEGRQEGLQTGIAEGMKRGEVAVLSRLLTRRFGPLPSEIVSKLNQASTDQLELWADNVVTAETLNAVFDNGDCPLSP